jgi:alpha-glucosidase
LPHGTDNLARSVESQEGDRSSLLTETRRFLALRRSPLLRTGTLDNLVCEGDMLSFERANANKRLRCIFNLGDELQELPPSSLGGTLIASVNGGTTDLLPPFAGIYVAI